ncbi:MAG: hypothetical protein H6R37_908, partial [Deltaproteobacteria bacterium]|nr:hypothetical protein [Deltaproteobacteria bacterium]
QQLRGDEGGQEARHHHALQGEPVVAHVEGGLERDVGQALLEIERVLEVEGVEGVGRVEPVGRAPGDVLLAGPEVQGQGVRVEEEPEEIEEAPEARLRQEELDLVRVYLKHIGRRKLLTGLQELIFLARPANFVQIDRRHRVPRA